MAEGVRKRLKYMLKTGKGWLSENGNGIQDVIVYVFPRAARILSLSYSLIGLFTYLFIFFLLFIDY